MANQWFRMYSEFMHDPKVQIMTEQYQRRLVMLLCMKCNGDETLHDKYVTFMLRISAPEWEQTKAVFIESGFIDSENNIMNWDKRQFVSDSSAERVKRHREKKKHDDVTHCNVTVTPPEQNRTDTEQIQNKENISKKSNRKKSKTLIPDDFCISDSVKAWAEEKGYAHLEKRLSHFVTVAQAKGYEYADWDAAFRNAISGDWAKLGGASKPDDNKPTDLNEFYRKIGAV